MKQDLTLRLYIEKACERSGQKGHSLHSEGPLSPSHQVHHPHRLGDTRLPTGASARALSAEGEPAFVSTAPPAGCSSYIQLTES